MISRCYDSANKNYKHYGGRGLTVCEEWRKSVLQFDADMGDRPEGTTLERIDVNGSYCPSNCRWASQKEQTRNARSNLVLEFDGKKQCLGAWAEELGINYSTLYGRVVTKGWPLEKAFRSFRR